MAVWDASRVSLENHWLNNKRQLSVNYDNSLDYNMCVVIQYINIFFCIINFQYGWPMAGSHVCIAMNLWVHSIRPHYIYFICFEILFLNAYFSWIIFSFHFFPTYIYYTYTYKSMLIRPRCCRRHNSTTAGPSGSAAVPWNGTHRLDSHFVFQSFQPPYIFIYIYTYIYIKYILGHAYGHLLGATAWSCKAMPHPLAGRDPEFCAFWVRWSSCWFLVIDIIFPTFPCRSLFNSLNFLRHFLLGCIPQHLIILLRLELKYLFLETILSLKLIKIMTVCKKWIQWLIIIRTLCLPKSCD